MNALEIVSLIASIVSVTIGAFAIWLSVKFYQMSNKMADETKDASRMINSSVNRLEVLFDRLYSDTFSIMKDTVSDMRKHIWPNKNIEEDSTLKEIEEKSDEKIATLKKDLTADIKSIIDKIGKTDNKVQNLQGYMEEIVDKAIKQSRKVEMETMEEFDMSFVLNTILQFLRARQETSIRRIFAHPAIRKRCSIPKLSEALEILQRENMIEASGPLDYPDTIIKRMPNA